MPHLSPMNWSLMVIIIWMFMFTFSSVKWWDQTMNWPKNKHSAKLPINSWKWFF